MIPIDQIYKLDQNSPVVKTDWMSMCQPVKLKKLHKDAKIPTASQQNYVGYDMTSISVEYDSEHDFFIYHTGWSIEANNDVCVALLANNNIQYKDVYMPCGIKIIDPDNYSDEICFIFKPQHPISEVSRLAALEGWASMSWWKKIKWRHYKKYFEQIHKYNLNHILLWVPYAPGECVGRMIISPYFDADIINYIDRELDHNINNVQLICD